MSFCLPTFMRKNGEYSSYGIYVPARFS
uniref:Uncharacterized protein n=1 Tax=Rhizophora mucronata TaxID=61149 RepID=A0A2P2J4A9_RHIMU